VNKVFTILLISISFSFQEKNKLIELINKAKTPNQIEIILSNFNTKENNKIFEYVPSINPLNPERLKRISSSFGERFHPITGKKKAHLGIDISAHKNLAVHSAASGKIIQVVYSNKGYGNYITIEHKYGFVTRYAHLNKIFVKHRQQIKKGEIIGAVGTTGSSTGNHLHYEIIKNKSHINPYTLIQ